MSDPLHISDPMVKCPHCGETHSSFFRCQERLKIVAPTSAPVAVDIKILTVSEYNAIVKDLDDLKAWKREQEGGK